MKIKRLIKKFLPRKFFKIIREVLYPEKIDVLEGRLNSVFFRQYRQISSPDLDQKEVFRQAEFKVYSKHGGDGILAYIFSKIGVANHTFIEMGVEDGRECNTANFSLNFGWQGLLIDANEEWLRSAEIFYATKLGARAQKVKIAVSFVTAENINKTIRENNLSGEIDLLSVDIDSNDYWVWKAVTEVNPRVVVMEYNAAFGLRSLTIKYDTDFYFKDTCRDNPLYFGASLSALAKLARAKGYILVACDCHGHDAFFIRKDLAEGNFIELSPEEAFYPNPFTVGKFGDLEKQFEMIRHLDIEEV